MAILMGWLFICLGALVLFFVLFEAWTAYQSQKWPTAVATILQSSLALGSNGDRRSGGTYTACVKYTYTVGDKTYTNDTLHFLYLRTGFEQRHAAYVAKYTPGETFDVYYSPKNPAKSVLLPGFPEWTCFVPLLFPVMFMLFGLFMTSWEK